LFSGCGGLKIEINKDGKTSVNGSNYHLTVEDVYGGLIRLYLKNMLNGEKINRLEQIHTPQIPVQQLMIEALDYGI